MVSTTTSWCSSSTFLKNTCILISSNFVPLPVVQGQQFYELIQLVLSFFRPVDAAISFLPTFPEGRRPLCAHPRQSTHRAPTCTWPPLFAPRTTPFSLFVLCTQVNRFLPRTLLESGVDRNYTLLCDSGEKVATKGLSGGSGKELHLPRHNFFHSYYR